MAWTDPSGFVVPKTLTRSPPWKSASVAGAPLRLKVVPESVTTVCPAMNRLVPVIEAISPRKKTSFGVAPGVPLGVPLGVPVGEAVGVAVSVAVALAEGLALAVAVGLALAVAVARGTAPALVTLSSLPQAVMKTPMASAMVGMMS